MKLIECLSYQLTITHVGKRFFSLFFFDFLYWAVNCTIRRLVNQNQSASRHLELLFVKVKTLNISFKVLILVSV